MMSQTDSKVYLQELIRKEKWEEIKLLLGVIIYFSIATQYFEFIKRSLM